MLKELTPGWYSFLYLPLQEYFVAQYAGRHNKLDELLRQSKNPWWEEVRILYARYTHDTNRLLQKQPESNTETTRWKDIFATNIILAGQYLAENPAVWQTSPQDEIVRLFNDPLFWELRTTPYSLTRQQAAETFVRIGKTGGKRINEGLINSLKNPPEWISLKVVNSLAEALATQGAQSITDELLVLLSDKSIMKEVRHKIAVALGKSGDLSVIDELVKLLADEEFDFAVRESIAESLGILGVGDMSLAQKLLLLLAKKETKLYIRRDIADTLGKMRVLSIASPLVNLLSNKDKAIDEEVCLWIAKALGSLGERSVIPQLTGPLFKWTTRQELARRYRSITGYVGRAICCS